MNYDASGHGLLQGTVDIPGEGEENCENVSHYRHPLGQELNQ